MELVWGHAYPVYRVETRARSALIRLKSNITYTDDYSWFGLRLSHPSSKLSAHLEVYESRLAFGAARFALSKGF